MSDVRATILEGLADGRSLRTICSADDMPNIATVMRWLQDDSAFCEQYARARSAGDDAMAEDIQAIADDGELDPNDRRIRVDARKWLLAKRQPKKYGEKQALEHSGPNGKPIDVRTLEATDAELLAIATGSRSAA